MTRQWPSFATHDLGETDEDFAELVRRWQAYDREMKALIAAGGVHQDADGWWVDDATGELIGPDPELERPLARGEADDLEGFEDVFPDLATSAKAEIARRGRPRVDNPKERVTLRLDADVIERLRASGKGWQSRVNETLRKAMGL